MQPKIEYVRSEKIKVNGKVVTITAGVQKGIDALDHIERQALAEFVYSQKIEDRYDIPAENVIQVASTEG